MPQIIDVMGKTADGAADSLADIMVTRIIRNRYHFEGFEGGLDSEQCKGYDSLGVEHKLFASAMYSGLLNSAITHQGEDLTNKNMRRNNIFAVRDIAENVFEIIYNKKIEQDAARDRAEKEAAQQAAQQAAEEEATLTHTAALPNQMDLDLSTRRRAPQPSDQRDWSGIGFSDSPPDQSPKPQVAPPRIIRSNSGVKAKKNRPGNPALDRMRGLARNDPLASKKMTL
jgi:hypothetical protein